MMAWITIGIIGIFVETINYRLSFIMITIDRAYTLVYNVTYVYVRISL